MNEGMLRWENPGKLGENTQSTWTSMYQAWFCLYFDSRQFVSLVPPSGAQGYNLGVSKPHTSGALGQAEVLWRHLVEMLNNFYTDRVLNCAGDKTVSNF